MARTDLKKESGDSGVYFYEGHISGEEYNRDLVGRKGLEIYDQMRRNDATVKASLKAVKLPIKGADYRIDIAPFETTTEEAANEKVRRVVEVSLFEFIDWKKFLGEALTALDFGFAVFEMVFEPRYVDGELRNALVKIGFRKQLSIYSWQTKEKTPGVTQTRYDGTTVSIPLEKIIHIAMEQEGDNYEGISVLRTAYKHWKYKDKFYLIDALGAENHALGIAKIKQPAGAKDPDIKRMKDWAKARRANQTSHIILPDGWDADLMNMQGSSLKDILPSIKHHDSQILKNVMAQFLGLETGSRALSEDHSRLFIKSVKDVADLVLFAVQRTAIKTLVDINFTVTQYPTIAIGNISDENIKEVTEGIKVAVEAGILHPASADENVVRTMLSLPERSIAELDEAFEKVEPVAPTPEAGKLEAAAELRALRASVETALYGPTDQAA